MNRRTAAWVMLVALGSSGWGATARPQDRDQPPPPDSPEVQQDRRVTFRLRADAADAVRLVGGDIPGIPDDGAMARGDGGVWELTLGPVPAGAYRYRFDVDGVPVVDPENTATSQSNGTVWSLVVVPGSGLSDTRDVPHGAVAEVTYQSETLGRPRRMHVYTPPGYERGDASYPVFYLLHGATDSDDSWTTVGRAGFILDNLIADGEAEPMIVVMPDGHLGRFRRGDRGSMGRQMGQFTDEFLRDIKPYVESHYRVRAGRQHAAIAGLSMGGAQTLNIAFAEPKAFAYVGVFSSGIFGIAGQGPGGAAPGPSWEEQHAEALDDPSTREGLERLWFATGSDDFLIDTTRATVEMLESHGLDATFKETDGGHTWRNWRDYLGEFAPMLFRAPE